MTKILEQKVISSQDDIVKLNIIDFKRCNGLWENNFLKALNAVSPWLIGNVMYTVIQEDMRVYPQRNDFPEWEHVGNHKYMAKLYWNMFYAKFDGTLLFHDAPDFSGLLKFDNGEVNFYGDIGQVSVSAFGVDVLPKLNRGDLWISIASEQQHTILEFMCDVGSTLKSVVVDQMLSTIAGQEHIFK